MIAMMSAVIATTFGDPFTRVAFSASQVASMRSTRNARPAILLIRCPSTGPQRSAMVGTAPHTFGAVPLPGSAMQ